MVAITALKPGDVVYDCRRTKMGNTTMTRLSTWRVHIKEVNLAEGWVLASWNGNAPTRYRPYQIARWRRTPPKGHAA